VAEVRREVARAKPFFEQLKAGSNLKLVGSATALPGSQEALASLLPAPVKALGVAPAVVGHRDSQARLKRQFDQLVNYTQMLVRQSPQRRAEFWAKADTSSAERWKETTGSQRDYIWDEVIGRLPPPDVPALPPDPPLDPPVPPTPELPAVPAEPPGSCDGSPPPQAELSKPMGIRTRARRGVIRLLSLPGRFDQIFYGRIPRT
jgi:hypothetical protein